MTMEPTLEEMEQRYRDALAALDKRIDEDVKRDREFWDDFAQRHGIALRAAVIDERRWGQQSATIPPVAR